MGTKNKKDTQSLMGIWMELMYQSSKKKDEPMKLNVELVRLNPKADEPEYVLEFEDWDTQEILFRISIREWFELKGIVGQLIYSAISDRCLDTEIKLRDKNVKEKD